MRRAWVKRKGNGGVILFFCGWGMDERAVQHLAGEDDLLVFHDYRDISREEMPPLETYGRVRVIAWSMGVWAASVLLNRWNIPVWESVAINGTERPVDEHYGIDPRVYLLTERGLTEAGRDKFFARMLPRKDELERFEANRPRRELDEQREELRLIREQSVVLKPEWNWNRAYVSMGDVIFPIENQRKWWNGRCVVIELKGGHYPFYELDNWEKI